MSFLAVSGVVGWLAVTMGTVSAYLQYRRVGRHAAHGVSLSTWTLFVLLALFWTLYGVAVRSWPLVAGTVLALPLQVMILVRLEPWRRASIVVRATAVAVTCCVVPALLWGWAGAVLGAGAAGTLTRLPQLVSVLRSDVVAGVSSESWLLAVAVSTLWVVYYAGAHLWAVLAVTAVAGSVSLSIALLSRRRQRAVTGSAP